MPWAAQYAAFQRLSEICETAALTPQERNRYEESIKVYRDNLAIAERAAEEGKEVGRKEGRKEGEELAKIEVARKMKANGFLPNVISEMTGLSEEQIASL